MAAAWRDIGEVVSRRRVTGLAAWGLLVGVAETAGVAALFLLGMVLATGGSLPEGALGDLAGRAAGALGLSVVLAVAVGLVVATLLRAVVALTYETLLGRLHQDVVLKATDTIFPGYFGMEYERFASRNSAERSLHLTTELDRAALAVVAFTRTVAMALVLVCMSIVLVVLDWRAALLGGASVVCIGLVVAPMVRRTSRLAKRRRDQQSILSVAVAEPLRAYRDLVTSGLWPRFHARVRRRQQGFVDVQRRLVLVNASMPHVLEAGVALVVVGAIIVVGQGVSQSAAMPILVLLVAGAYRFLPALQRFLSSFGGFRTNEPCLIAVVAEMREVRQHARHHMAMPDQDLGDVILSLRGVHFAHAGQEALLNGLDLELRRQERIGIVGASGAGKTTLVDLVLGLLRPAAGRVVRGRGVHGRPLRVAYLPQQPVFAQGTVLDNLALANEAAVDRLEARRLLTLVGLGDLPLDLQLGEAGSGLSGGERQRLGLARALHGDPDLLLLDEPTGALDSTTEREVLDALDRLEGVAMLIVTHRKAPLALCDTVLRLEDGQFEPMGAASPGRPLADPLAPLRAVEPAV